MWQFWIFEKRRSQSHAYEIGRQYRFAARDGGKPTKRQQHERNELGLGFAYAVADLAEKPRRELRQQHKDNRRRSSKEREPQVKMSKHDAEREHGTEIVHKTGGENNLAEFSLVEAGFDHHGIDEGSPPSRGSIRNSTHWMPSTMLPRPISGVRPMRAGGQKPKSPFSGRVLQMVLHKLGVKNATVHGFRSSFRDWAGNVSNFPREITETALAHVIGDNAEQAYRRGDALEKRRKLMEAWASYCEQSNSNNIVQLTNRKR